MIFTIQRMDQRWGSRFDLSFTLLADYLLSTKPFRLLPSLTRRRTRYSCDYRPRQPFQFSPDSRIVYATKLLDHRDITAIRFLQQANDISVMRFPTGSNFETKERSWCTCSMVMRGWRGCVRKDRS